MIDPYFYKIGSPKSLADLATQLGLELPVEGAGDEMISVPSALHDSLPGSISFFSDKRRQDQLATAQATACFTTEKLRPLVSKTGIIALVTDSPRAVFARLSGEMVTVGGSKSRSSGVDPSANIHPSAVIGENVTIGAGTTVRANCVIDEGVVIGENCMIEPLAHISFAYIGDGCHIKSGAVIGGTGFGMTEDSGGIFTVPHLGRVILGNGVHIGANSCVDRGQLGDTILSDDVKIDNMVQIAHNVRIGEGTMIAAQGGISGSVVIGKKCLFGGRASIADHIKVGDGAIIAAAAGIMADVPAGQMYSGIPAMPIREHMRSVATLKKLARSK